MCGIAGVFARGRPATGPEVQAVRAMAAAQAHRGPDGEGLLHEGPAVLGHRRLAIIDLSDQGAQPLGGNGLWITFNGEIYNYRDLRREVAAAGHPCATQTDTEVILRGYEAWGMEGVLRRLEGMFAFGLFDGRVAGDPVLYLARDRFGIKPLYVADDGGRVAFASEVRALVRSGLVARTLDSQAVIGYLALASVPAPRTFVAGVGSVLPATFVRVDNAGTRSTAYWELPAAGTGGDRPTEDELAAALRQAATDHLIADVPVGVFLSGGVDAASLVAVTASATGDEARLRTLTLVFDGDESHEGDAAAAIAARHGTDHHQVLLTGTEFEKCLPDFLSAVDQPSNDGVNTYFISRAARSVGLKAVLSGLGGDEVFLGYPHHHRLVSAPGRAAAAVPAAAWRVLSAGAAAVGARRNDERVQRFGYSARHSPSVGWYLLARGFFPPTRVAQLAGCTEAEVHEVVEDVLAGAGGGAAGVGAVPAEPLAGVNHLELRRYLHDQLLRDTDVFSMAHSLEARVPLLDRRLVEVVNRVPLRDRLSSDLNKPLLARASGDPAVLDAARRPKQGFTLPIGRWMRERPSLADDLLAGAAGGMLDRSEVKAAWDGFQAGNVHWSRIWALVTLQAAA